MSEKLIIANAFSLSMLPPTSKLHRLEVREVSLEEARKIIKYSTLESAVGHASTANVLTTLLGVEIPPRRVMIKLEKGTKLLVFQLFKRLPEGAVLSEEEVKQLPFKFYLVQLL